MPCTWPTTCSTRLRASCGPGPTIADDEAERTGATRGDRDQRQKKHVRELDDPRGRAAEGEHLEDRRAIGDEAVRTAELVARERERRIDPLGELRFFVERLQRLARGREGR